MKSNVTLMKKRRKRVIIWVGQRRLNGSGIKAVDSCKYVDIVLADKVKIEAGDG